MEDKCFVINRKYIQFMSVEKGYECDVITLMVDQDRPDNKYVVVNIDEPYAEKLYRDMLIGEENKLREGQA